MDLSQINIKQLIIRQYPDPILRQAAQPVQRMGADIMFLADKMAELMLQADGIGLAATQVGVPLQMFVLCLSGKPEDVNVFINPRLDGFDGQAETEEGCLSLPGVRYKVRRPSVCRVSALDLEGNEFVTEMVNLASTAAQHEYDHLQGTLFIDRLSTISRMACRKTLKQLQQQFEAK